MTDAPRDRTDYPPDQLERIRRLCLYVATKLGDLVEEVVIVGGLVPSLLISQEDLSSEEERHPGTLDLDMGLRLTLLSDERYAEVAERLREAGFTLDRNKSGNPTVQRWMLEEQADGVHGLKIDFLIPPLAEGEGPGTIKHLERDLGAVVTPGLELAFRNREKRQISGLTIKDEKASREVWVCGAGAYVVLKALATKNRGKNKDPFDLLYVLRHYGSGVSEVAEAVRPLLDSSSAQEALAFLDSDFTDPDGIGPSRAAEFLHLGPNEEYQADAAGDVRELLRLLGHM